MNDDRAEHVAARLPPRNPRGLFPVLVQDLACALKGDAALASRDDAGMWPFLSWHDFAHRNRCVGLGLAARGLHKHDVVCILSWTRPEWIVADIGAQGVGLVSAGIYPTDSPGKIRYVVNDCRARVIFVENQAQYDKVASIWGECSTLELIVHFEPLATTAGSPTTVSFDELVASGDLQLRKDPGGWLRLNRDVEPDDLALLIYTSGTTGDPKGAMLSHANVSHQIEHCPALYGMQAGWRRPAYLPLCHVAERLFTYYSIANAGVNYFVPDVARLNEQLVEIRPHFILGVPRVYEKIQRSCEEWLAAQPALVKRQYQQDLATGLRYARLRLAGAAVDDDLQKHYDLARRRQAAGILRGVGLDQIVVLTSGGARFPSDLMLWMWAVGLPMLELYGMSECGIIATNRVEDLHLDTVGKPTAFGELKFSPAGEILVAGQHVFRGYLNKPEKNSEAFEGRWFRTGDIGRLDANGNLILSDRINDMIITGSGKNIAPSIVEIPLKRAGVIADAIVVGEGRNYLTALVVLDLAAVQESFPDLAAARHSDPGQLCLEPMILSAVQQEIDRVNASVSRAESIRKFRILPRVFGPTDEEMTPTMKVRRKLICGKYSDLIGEMYA